MLGSSCVAMDTDTAEAIDRLSDRIDRLEFSLRGEIAGIRGDMVDMRDGLRGEIAEMRDGLRAEMAAVRDEFRRHTDVVAESLRDDIRMVAEGVAHLAVKIDGLQR